MDPALQEMFQKSGFSISTETYIYAKVAHYPLGTDHFMIAQDDDEITVVTGDDRISDLDVIEQNENKWCLVSKAL